MVELDAAVHPQQRYLPRTRPLRGGLPYIGRFAPSPSGPLHFGSLVCALASYLDARARRGKWLVRIEDIDPPREPPGARAAILHCLDAHGLHWDGELVMQSQRHEAYRELLEKLLVEGLCYRCNCTRKRLASLGGVYDGHCRDKPPASQEAAALRLKVANLPAAYGNVNGDIAFTDDIQGRQRENLTKSCGDFVIHRKDGLFAYQLAVVVDDIAQKVTHIVRGIDLLETTARQIYLFRLLGQRAPRFAHIPVLVGADGQKLSKQNHAPAVNIQQPTVNLCQALGYLGMTPPRNLQSTSPTDLLGWAIEHWQRDTVPQTASLRFDCSDTGSPEPSNPVTQGNQRPLPNRTPLE